jgi:hypothetical protein
VHGVRHRAIGVSCEAAACFGSQYLLPAYSKSPNRLEAEDIAKRQAEKSPYFGHKLQYSKGNFGLVNCEHWVDFEHQKAQKNAQRRFL